MVYLEGQIFEGIPKVTERYGIWTKIVHNLRGSLDNIKGNMQQAELKLLDFNAIWDKGIFYRQISDKVEWFYSTPKYLFKPTIRISKKDTLLKGISLMYTLTIFLNSKVVSFFGQKGI